MFIGVFDYPEQIDEVFCNHIENREKQMGFVVSNSIYFSDLECYLNVELSTFQIYFQILQQHN